MQTPHDSGHVLRINAALEPVHIPVVAHDLHEPFESAHAGGGGQTTTTFGVDTGAAVMGATGAAVKGAVKLGPAAPVHS